MECLQCHFENPEGIRFCGDCGAKLQEVCPECGNPNPSHFRFCGKCGKKLAAVCNVTEPSEDGNEVRDQVDWAEDIEQGQNENDGWERVVSHGRVPPLYLE